MSSRPPQEPVVTVLVPMYNEASDIGGCIEAIGRQSYPLERIELIMVDAASTDDTVDKALDAAASFAFARVAVLPNPRRTISVGLNIGLADAAGDVVVRVDARSRIQTDHVHRCVATLSERADVGVTGGAQLAVPRSQRPIARAIARALNNHWTMGLARYRRRASSGCADTVWMGSFRTAQLRAIGGWDARRVLNEDYELNGRYRSAGLRVWFDSDLRAQYLPRQSLWLLARQYFRFGRAKGLWWARDGGIAGRHVVLLATPPIALLAGGIGIVRWGWMVVGAAAATAALAADAIGSTDRAGVHVRCAAILASGVISASWWTGVVVGWLGERHGRTSERGVLPNDPATPAMSRQ